MTDSTDAKSIMLDRLDEFDHPFDVNEHGLWCPMCGELQQASFHIDETYVPPENCKHCGWPDDFDPEAV